jgi:hypothetical protein
MAIPNSNLASAVPATVFVPARCSTLQGPPPAMDHGSCISKWVLKDKTFLTPTGTTDYVPHSGKALSWNPPTHIPECGSGEAASRASFQLIDLPARLYDQEQASGMQ